MRQRRYVCLYAPAVVLAIWVLVFSELGRSDATVISGAAVLAVALAFFATQIIRDLKRRDKREQELKNSLRGHT